MDEFPFNHLKRTFAFTNARLPKELLNKMVQILKTETLPKGHLLIKEGHIAHRLYFLEKGTARTYYYHKAKDITSWIYREDTPFTTWYSFINNQASFENLEIVEDAILHSFSKDDLEKLYSTNPHFERFGRKMYEQQLAYLDVFYKGYMFMTAKERYDLLLSTFPDVTQRVNLGHIASLLGISQETLSRIRAKK